MPATLPAPYPMVDPAIYGSGKGVVEVAVWNLDGAPSESGLPIWLVVLSAAIPVGLIVAAVAAKETKMAAKKKRGLSGSPEHHADKVVESYLIARDGFDQATTDVRRNRCGSALNWLKLGVGSYERAELHRREAGLISASFPDTAVAATKAEANAFDKFRKACLVGGGLSGLRRKARKARR